MRPTMRLLILLSTAGCITPELLEQRACPCITPGWYCDEALSPPICVRGEPSALDGSALDGSALDGSALDAPALDAVADVPRDATGDAGLAVPPPISTRCWSQPTSPCDWTAPSFEFVEVTSGNFADYEAANATFSPDGCEILYAVFGATADVYRVVRDGPGMPFGAPEPISGVNLPGSDEDAPSMSPDGLELFVASTRGASGLRRVFRFDRVAVTEPWNPVGVPIASLDIASSINWEPRLAPHGLRLYVALQDPVQFIRVVERDALGANFGAPVRQDLAGLMTDHWTNRPSVTHDDRVLVGVQQVPDSTSTRRAFFATRPDWNDAWSRVAAVPTAFGADGMRDIGVSPDGCEIVARTTTTSASGPVAALLRYRAP